MKINKKILLPILIVIWLLSITYAWFSWTSSNNTNVSFDINGITVTYNGGDNISGVKLLPVTNRADGVVAGTAIEKTITAQSNKPNVYMNLYLDIESIDTGLKHNTFKWELVEGNTSLGSGNFANANAGDTINLVTDEELTTTTSTYKLYIWIDGNEHNPEEMENKSFEFVLRADATDQRPQTASEKIIELAGNCTSWDSGFEGICGTSPYDDNGTTKYHEYRYIGAEPNNYVKFNDDLYQIIGVFDKNSYDRDSVENNDYGDYLIKLIMADTLTSATWGATNTADAYTTYSAYNNNWETANANILLNEYFLNASNTSTTYKACSDWTYYKNNNNYKTKNCSKIVGYGIKTNDLRNYIQPVTWYLKGYNSNSYSKQNFYTCERSDTETISKCTSGNNGAYATKVENKSIGLMYVSDYLYASGYYASTNTATASQQYYGQQNWLYNGDEWTMTPVGSGGTYAFDVYNGSVSNSSTLYPYALRPTFYLKSKVMYESGTGSFKDPFVISCDNCNVTD